MFFDGKEKKKEKFDADRLRRIFDFRKFRLTQPLAQVRDHMN